MTDTPFTRDDADVFPISEEEMRSLEQLGWSRGLGWRTGFGWYHDPSSGPAIFIDENPGYMARWLDDLKSIRCLGGQTNTHRAFLSAAINSATALHDVGYDAQKVIGALPEIMWRFHAIAKHDDRVYRDEAFDLLASLRRKP